MSNKKSGKKSAKSSTARKVKNESKGLFCTECGEELNDFSFSEKNKNFRAVMANHKNCVKTGKFAGDICSKVFISSNMLMDGIWSEDDK